MDSSDMPVVGVNKRCWAERHSAEDASGPVIGVPHVPAPLASLSHFLYLAREWSEWAPPGRELLS